MNPDPTRNIGVIAVLALLTIACTPPSEPRSIEYLETPAGANARSPNMATNDAGLTVLSWLEPDGEGHALRFSQFSDGTWGPASTVVNGDNWFVNWADFPSVVPVSDTLWGAHWLVSQPDGGYAYDVNVSMSVDGGESWSDPVIPHSDGTPTEHGFVSMFPQDNGVGLVWLDGRNMINEYDPDVIVDGMTLRTAVMHSDGSITGEQEIDGLICDCCQTDVTVTNAGLLAAYRNRSEAEIRDIYIAHSTDEGWQEGRVLADDNWEIAACPVNGPVLDSIGENVAAAWFTGVNETSHVRLTWSDDSGQTFSAPLEIATGNLFGHVGVAMLDTDSAVISWLRKSAALDAELVVARVDRAGNSGPEVIIGNDQSISGYTVPQLVLVDDQLLVAWTAGSYDDSHVRSAVVPIELLQ